jgi:hypothetical protein
MSLFALMHDVNFDESTLSGQPENNAGLEQVCLSISVGLHTV